jgi:sterol desaturase/sphingolipid hydroxylase (fatty acid hydroxylase superfamily)
MMFGDILAYSATAVRSSLGVVVEPGHFLSLGPLLVALAIALVALRLRSQQRGRLSGWRHLLAMLFPRRIFLHRSARLDYAIFLINEGLLFFLTLGAIVTPAVLANVLLDVVGYRTDASGSSGVILAERAICTLYLVLLWDFGATFAHYLKHRVPLLWEFHKVHHSAEVLTPVTALRRHPVDSLVGAAMTTFAMGTGMAIWVLVLQRPPDAIGIFGTVAGIYLWRLLGYNLRHSHVWISYGDFWNGILISPAQHQVHHSVDPRHYDKNFGHIFACWDRLFGTLYLPAHDERVVFGIEAAEMPHYRNLFGVYVMPFVKAANLVLRRPQPAPVEVADRTSAD